MYCHRNTACMMIPPRSLFAIFFAAAVTLSLFAMSNFLSDKSETETIVILYSEAQRDSEPLKVKAEIADSPEEITTGLMFRESLGKGDGMLFVFPDSAVRNFWMKNTIIPLDMIFIAENMTIVKIHHAMPCVQGQCPLYNSGQPAKYVLEVNGNLTTDYVIEEGGKVVIES